MQGGSALSLSVRSVSSVAHGVCLDQSMSLAEIVASLACNFIVAGVFWYLKGPNAGLLCLGIGFILLILAYFVRKKPSQPESALSQHNEQRVEASPQQIVNIGSDILRPPGTLPVPATPILKQVEDPDITILPSEDRRLSDFHDYAPAFSVIVACLRNDSMYGQRSDFAAHIVYKDENGNEVTDVGRGIWLSRISSTTVRFPTGITQRLAIFLSNGSGLLKPVAARHRVALAGRPIVLSEITEEKFKQQIASVEIRLLREARPPIILNLTVETINGKTTLVQQN